MIRRSLFVFLVCFCLAGCGAEGDGLVKQQVTGSVLVNGRPLERVIVMFNHQDKSVKGNASRPIAATDADGRFSLSTSGTADGAVAGEYIITFELASANYASTADLFRGKYSTVAKSEYKVVIGSDDVELPPFELKVPAEWLPKDGGQDGFVPN